MLDPRPHLLAEGRLLAKIARNVTIKVPLTWDGLKACKTLSGEGTMVNVTLCFSANQALLAEHIPEAVDDVFQGRGAEAARHGGYMGVRGGRPKRPPEPAAAMLL